MNRIERLAAILLLLQEHALTAAEIAHRFEVSRRTILRDVQALSEMGVPVIAREGPGGGYSLAEEYRAAPLPLTGKEAFLLLLSLNTIEHLSDLPFKREFVSLQAKLRAQMPQKELSGAEGLLSTIGSSLPEHDQHAPFLEDLMEAARQGAWVKVVYRSSERISTQHMLPHQVYTQDGFWYLRAYSNERREERTYRVDRVQSVELPELGFTPHPIVEGLPYAHESHPLVSALFTRSGADRMSSDRHLGPQLKRKPDGSGEIAFRCPPAELDFYARFFAGMGRDVEVTGPPELCLLMLDIGQNLIELYG